MTDDSTLGELPRYSRDIAVTSTPGRSHIDPGSFGVLEPFAGLLDASVEHGRQPRPDLSYLTLAPFIAAAHDRASRSRVNTARWGDNLPGEPPRETESDADDEEPTVREVLDLETSGGRGGDPDRTLVDAANRDSSGRERTTGDEMGGRSDEGGAGDAAPGRDASGRPILPSLTDVDVTRSTDRAPGRTASTTGRPGPVDAGSARGAGVRGDVVPPAMTLSGANGGLTADATDGATAGLRGRQSDSRPGSPDRPERPGAGGPDAGPRLTVRSESSRAADVDAPGGGDSAAHPAGTTGGGASASSGAAAPSGGGGQDDGGLSQVLAESADPESRLVDRLFRALKERQAIERRRRGGR